MNHLIHNSSDNRPVSGMDLISLLQFRLGLRSTTAMVSQGADTLGKRTVDTVRIVLGKLNGNK